MTTTNIISKPKPKYRKQLNQDQVAILQLLYQFRFASNKHIAVNSEKNSSKDVQKRIKILEDQGLISKRYDKSYKLKGKPAAYYLLPDGARALMKYLLTVEDEPVNIKRIYKDKDVSEGFIEHCLYVLGIYLQLRAQYGKKLSVFTKSRLSFERYGYFPQPLPDAYIRLKTSDGEKQFFLDIFAASEPFFVLVRRVKKYLQYVNEGDWAITRTDLPAILMVTEALGVQKRLRKRIAKELRESWEDEVVFATAMLGELLNAGDTKGRVWRPIDEDGDDPEEPVKPRSINTI